MLTDPIAVVSGDSKPVVGGTGTEEWHSAAYVQGRLGDGVVVTSSPASANQQQTSSLSPPHSSTSQPGTGAEGTEFHTVVSHTDLFRKLEEVYSIKYSLCYTTSCPSSL
jgi:hypothetical protein